MARIIGFIIILCVCVAVFVWSVSSLIDVISRQDAINDSIPTTSISAEKGQAISHHRLLERRPLIVAALSSIHMYISSILALFFTSVIRFYTNLLCKYINDSIEKKRRNKKLSKSRR
ncbi:MAG: hypothetical protein AAGA27_01735 [Pseudomonadota bacterium]